VNVCRSWLQEAEARAAAEAAVTQMAGKLEASKSDLRHAEERLVAAVKARKELQAKLEEIGSARPVSAHVSEYPQQLSACPPCACDHVSGYPCHRGGPVRCAT
jgi:chromosome segregation ATPase